MDGLTLEGRVALVTGAGGGIGRRIALDLASLGAVVAVCSRRGEGAEEVASAVREAGASARAYGAVDFVDRSAISELVRRVGADLGQVDVLVSNAGWEHVSPFVDSDPELWDRLLAINLRAPIQLTHAFLPGMVERNWGRLVYVSSDAGRVGSKGEAVYAAAKSGLFGFSKTIAREAARSGVTSNVVCPGPTDTPLLREVAAGNENLVAALTRRIPAGRLGEPADVSGVVSFLASQRAAYVTGQTISVSGGLTMA